MTTRRHRSAGPGAAFTLFEVLLALVLTSALLAALGSAVSMHLRAFERGRDDVEQAQLARALLQRVASDLRAAAATSAVVPAAESFVAATRSEPGNGRPLALGEPWWRGTTNSLRLVVWSAETASAQATSEANTGDNFALDRPSSALTRLEYFLKIEPEQSATDGASGGGLVRRARPWWGPEEASDQRGRAGGTSGILPAESARAARRAGPEDDWPEAILAGEVVSLRWRYADRGKWVSQWDSRLRGGPPAAVEIAISIARADAAAELRRTWNRASDEDSGRAPIAAGSPDRGEDSIPSGDQAEPRAEEEEGAKVTTYRLVVDLHHRLRARRPMPTVDAGSPGSTTRRVPRSGQP